MVDSAPKTRATAEAGSQKRQFCRPLPTQFRHNGFDYRQTARESDAAIYEQVWAGRSNPSVRYEVIRIRKREGFEIHGGFVEPAEVLSELGSLGREWIHPYRQRRGLYTAPRDQRTKREPARRQTGGSSNYQSHSVKKAR